MPYVVNEKQKGRICSLCNDRPAFSKGLCQICLSRERNRKKCESEGREYKPRNYDPKILSKLIEEVRSSGCTYDPIPPQPFNSSIHMEIVIDGNKCWIDKDDKHLLGDWTWRVNSDGYLVRKSLGKSYQLHRQVNQTPDGMITDHINGNKLDNRRCNLRSVTNQQNSFNRICRGEAKGVSHFKKNGKWRVQITFNQHNYHGGYFETEDQARRAYNDAARYLFGQFARLNNVD